MFSAGSHIVYQTAYPGCLQQIWLGKIQRKRRVTWSSSLAVVVLNPRGSATSCGSRSWAHVCRPSLWLHVFLNYVCWKTATLIHFCFPRVSSTGTAGLNCMIMWPYKAWKYCLAFYRKVWCYFLTVVCLSFLLCVITIPIVFSSSPYLFGLLWGLN